MSKTCPCLKYLIFIFNFIFFVSLLIYWQFLIIFVSSATASYFINCTLVFNLAYWMCYSWSWRLVKGWEWWICPYFSVWLSFRRKCCNYSWCYYFGCLIPWVLWFNQRDSSHAYSGNTNITSIFSSYFELKFPQPIWSIKKALICQFVYNFSTFLFLFFYFKFYLGETGK